MPERDQVRALKLLTDALASLRALERRFPFRIGNGAEEQARHLADEIAEFLRTDQGGK